MKKRKQRVKRKSLKAETIKKLPPSSKCYCFSHSRASRIQKFFLSPSRWPTMLFTVPWLLHFEIHFAGRVYILTWIGLCVRFSNYCFVLVTIEFSLENLLKKFLFCNSSENGPNFRFLLSVNSAPLLLRSAPLLLGYLPQCSRKFLCSSWCIWTV